MSKTTRRFIRQIDDPNADLLSLNERCSVHLIREKEVVIVKEGVRIIGYYDKWPEMAKLEYIRDEFVRILKDPRNEPDPDWSVLAA
jgi:hypothetical protein